MDISKYEYNPKISKERKILKQLRENNANVYRRELNVDNVLIDLFFSNADKLSSDASPQLDFEQSKKIDEICYIIDNMIPDIEKQVIYLLFFLKKNQETVGKLLNISQEMVYYYKKRALTRIKIHYFFRSVDIAQMEEFLTKYVTKKQKTAMIEYFKEHDLRKIAKTISELEGRKKQINYEAIGSRIKLGLRKLKVLREATQEQEVKDKANLYFEIFSILKRNNSLHHTQSKKRVKKEICG